jgi:hypothetical protein
MQPSDVIAIAAILVPLLLALGISHAKTVASMAVLESKVSDMRSELLRNEIYCRNNTHYAIDAISATRAAVTLILLQAGLESLPELQHDRPSASGD